MTHRFERAVYVLLFLYIAVSLTYEVVSSTAFITDYFGIRNNVHEPFQMDLRHLNVTEVRPGAKEAGIGVGDVLESVNGKPYQGHALWQSIIWHAKPGHVLTVGLRKPDGTRKEAAIHLQGWDRLPPIGEAIPLTLLMVAIPAFCLFVGYWVALARPHDPNAWFILAILTFPQVFTNVGTINWWPGPWLVLRLSWHLMLDGLAPAALLWFGFYFPERSRIDRRLPWLKWVILAAHCGPHVPTATAAVSLVDDVSRKFTHGRISVQGEIKKGDFAEFSKAADRIRRNWSEDGVPDIWVELDSPGDDVVEAMKIGRLVRQRFMTTIVLRRASAPVHAS
jgi:hypothetical protein